MPDLHWEKWPSGDWKLFDKPQGTPRFPVGSIFMGRHGSDHRAHLTYDAGHSVTKDGRSVAALKRWTETQYREHY